MGSLSRPQLDTLGGLLISEWRKNAGDGWCASGPCAIDKVPISTGLAAQRTHSPAGLFLCGKVVCPFSWAMNASGTPPPDSPVRRRALGEWNPGSGQNASRRIASPRPAGCQRRQLISGRWDSLTRLRVTKRLTALAPAFESRSVASGSGEPRYPASPNLYLQPWTAGRICISRARCKPLRNRIKDLPIRSVHGRDTVQIASQPLRIAAMGNPAFRRDNEGWLPHTLNIVLAPLGSYRLPATGRRPEHSVSSIITIKRCRVRRCFQVRMIWAQVPFVRVRVDARPSVASEENFAACLAVKQFHNSGTALARQHRCVKEAADQTRGSPNGCAGHSGFEHTHSP